MQAGGRVSAAIEVLGEIETRKRPASEALKDWGISHRFAGSGDRAAIGNLVFDALRVKASSEYLMQSDSPRALALRALVSRWGETPEAVAALCDGSRFAPEPLTDAEKTGLAAALPEDAPAHIKGEFPDWLSDELARAFGEDAAAEGVLLSLRAPLDLRVNTLKADREKVLKALQRFGAQPTPHSPVGIRITAGVGAKRSPHVEAEAAHGKGWFEVQDEGSQLAALLSGVAPKQQVIDLCAGAGGKTLALAAAMRNTGQLYAYDSDRMRLRPVFERLKRAGARNVQVLEAGNAASLLPLEEKLDLVMIDAPCSGSGVWRRRPDAKWRLSPAMLETRQQEQQAVLEEGAKLVKPGGRLCYITCSLLPCENQDQAVGFLARHPDFAALDLAPGFEAVTGAALPEPRNAGPGLVLTPRRFGTDGFFVFLAERQS
ncbi:RsmB/NOP family class I SAM-dependent RNA methyltransferase [Methyloligella sp. 2.7D]|uniref:RsmB/NOP family class I SAM-dependent RNA methyltransferase n=1 Tax=unclassified Methyloligella TaxID=2625955 RepID=UPI00157C9704|nr:RsmB/NOP family class I SAM-dependent RNA methyltransferase [Methyloligella sp. GL2]QKP77217.1 RsmB/NOP family class I SAM-dependent RNA methyltransferase [Methyloligella sp. GL2]